MFHFIPVVSRIGWFILTTEKARATSSSLLYPNVWELSKVMFKKSSNVLQTYLHCYYISSATRYIMILKKRKWFFHENTLLLRKSRIQFPTHRKWRPKLENHLLRLISIWRIPVASVTHFAGEFYLFNIHLKRIKLGLFSKPYILFT